MNMIWVLLGIVLVLLFLGTRERLEPTDKIKAPGSDPSNPYTDEEVNRALAMVPDSVKQAVIQLLSKSSNADTLNKEEFMRNYVNGDMGLFYNIKYAPARTSITQDDIEAYLKEYSSGEPDVGINLKRAALTAYFINQNPPPAQQTGPPSQNLQPVTISPPSTVPPSPVQPVPVQPPSPDTNAPPVPLPGAPTASTPASANGPPPTRWTHVCFFSPSN